MDNSEIRELQKLVIELKTEFREYRLYSAEKFEMIQETVSHYNNLENEVVTIKGDVDENTKMRNKVNNIAFGLLAETILIIAGLLILLKDKVL